MKSARYFFASILLIGLLEAAPAAEWYVATNGPGGGATSWETATDNIQDAISLCSSGDVVWVSNGVYETGGVTWPVGTVLTTRVAITTRYVTVRSANNDPANTIIKGRFDTGAPWEAETVTNGPSAVRCVYMTNNTTLIGFTLTNGATLDSGDNTYHQSGGGIHAQYSLSPPASAIISNCVIVGNSAYFRGGGAYGGSLYNCTIRGNSATSGGGGAMGVLFNCSIISNWTWRVSAHLYQDLGGGTRFSTLYNCLLAGNSAWQGGGDSQGYLYNCTVVGNYASYKGGGLTDQYLVHNCIAYYNSCSDGPNWGAVKTNALGYPYAYTNSCTIPAIANWGAGNITNAPMFVDQGGAYGLNHTLGDYRLSNVSPCINTGTNQPWMMNALDLEGRRRVDGYYGTVDMGCFEYYFKGSIFKAR